MFSSSGELWLCLVLNCENGLKSQEAFPGSSLESELMLGLESGSSVCPVPHLSWPTLCL